MRKPGEKINISDGFRDCLDVGWQFVFDEFTGVAWVSNSKQPTLRHPVIDGTAIIDGIPYFEELGYRYPYCHQIIKWVSNEWTRAVGKDVLLPLYGTCDTRFVENRRFGYLENEYCPLCLKQRDAFEVHHAIFKSDGGHNTVENLLSICCSCHALINWGCDEDRIPRLKAALHHQFVHYGIALIPLTCPPSGKHKHVHPLEKLPYLKTILDTYTELQRSYPDTCDSTFKSVYRILYQYDRDIARGLWKWKPFKYECEELPAES